MDELAVGVISASFGTGGWCKVRRFAVAHAHFARIRQLYIQFPGGLKSFAVEAVRAEKNLVCVKLIGVDSPEDVKKLCGRVLWVERKDAQSLSAGEYFSADICRCALFFGEERIGEVTAVCEGAAHDLLEIDRGARERLFVPFVDHFIGAIDLERKRIELKEDYILR